MLIKGLTAEQFELLDELLVAPLKKTGSRVWVFGSRARGDHRLFSDIDLLFEIPVGHDLPSGMLFQIKDNVSESNLPYKVDLVELKELAPSYREQVLRERIEL